MKQIKIFCSLLIVASLAGCAGTVIEDPNVHYIPNPYYNYPYVHYINPNPYPYPYNPQNNVHYIPNNPHYIPNIPRNIPRNNPGNNPHYIPNGNNQRVHPIINRDQEKVN